VKATQNQLQDLLELSAIDQSMTRTRAELDSLVKTPKYVELQQSLRATSADFISATNKIDGLKLELSRLESDVDLVNKRMEKDQAALRTTSVVKDAQGLQAEIRTLERRRGELEDQELDLMQQLETADAELAAVAELRANTEQELKTVIEGLEKERLRLLSGIELANADRKQLADRLPEELVSLYQAKLKRGIAVGRLIHSECGACRMSVSATNLAEIIRQPIDEIVNCPDCGAILVR
jgi:predicted  nucleic acid-binding Zn-ribbon protein